jgi:hypothetical protein
MVYFDISSGVWLFPNLIGKFGYFRFMIDRDLENIVCVGFHSATIIGDL